MTMSPAVKNFITTLALCLVSVGAGVGAFVFATMKISAGIDARAVIIPEIYRLSEERVLGRGVGSLLTTRQDDLSRIQGFFADRARPLAFVESMQQAAKATGNFAEFAVSEKGGSNTDLLFRASIEGTEKSVMRYVRAIESLPYIVFIEEASFEKIAPGSRRPRAGFSTAEVRLSIAIRVKTASTP